jgi:hypothetical protein
LSPTWLVQAALVEEEVRSRWVEEEGVSSRWVEEEGVSSRWVRLVVLFSTVGIRFCNFAS